MMNVNQLVKEGFEVRRNYNVFLKSLPVACVKDEGDKVEIYEILEDGTAIYYNTIYKKEVRRRF